MEIVFVAIAVGLCVAIAVPLTILLIMRRHLRRLHGAAWSNQPVHHGRYRAGSGGYTSSDSSWAHYNSAGTTDSGWSGSSFGSGWSGSDHSSSSSSSSSCDSGSSSSSDSGSSSSSSSSSSSCD